jgi:hypothetical protein
MAWALRAYVDVGWIPEGTGSATVGPIGGEGNQPGFGANANAGPLMNAQTLRIQISEMVGGLGSQSSSALSTALGTAAAQLGTDLTTLLQNTATLATIFGWATGNP